MNEEANELWSVYAMECYAAAKNEWSTDTCYNMDVLEKHYAEWKKPGMKGHKLYDSIYMNEICRLGKAIETESRDSGEGRQEYLLNGYKTVQHGECSKCHWIVCFKMFN